MADKCDLRLLGLIVLSSLLTGISGVEDHVFISSGENVRLSCNNALSDCTSKTTWNYSNRFRRSKIVELITKGIKKKDAERHERLSLESDCSLNIKNVTEEDYGLYTCQQWIHVNGNDQQQGSDASVSLHVLHVSVSPSSSSSSSSSSQTEISPGRSVTLSCQLYSVDCDYLVSSEGFELLWVNQAGVDLKTDSRYQILSSSDQYRCFIITLTTTLLNEDDNREWRCQLTHRNQLKTSVRYTVKYSDSEDHWNKNTPVIVISVAVRLLALLWLICRKRADNKRGTGDSAVKDENDHKGTYETINMSIPPAAKANEQTDVTYSEVTSSNTKPVKSLNDHDDTVTYAAIRGREDQPQDQLYASVNKNKTFTNKH